MQDAASLAARRLTDGQKAPLSDGSSTADIIMCCVPKAVFGLLVLAWYRTTAESAKGALRAMLRWCSRPVCLPPQSNPLCATNPEVALIAGVPVSVGTGVTVKAAGAQQCQQPPGLM